MICSHNQAVLNGGGVCPGEGTVKSKAGNPTGKTNEHLLQRKKYPLTLKTVSSDYSEVCQVNSFEIYLLQK